MSGKLLHDFRVQVMMWETRLRRYVITSVGKQSPRSEVDINSTSVWISTGGDLIHFFQKILHLLVLVVVKSAV